MDEFALGGSTENSAFGVTKNPHDETRIPGGSSGGSAAAVASNQCIAALGTDTGGSIRQPAAMCGVVGLKPTYGRISRYGLTAFASSLDQIGPITENVADAAIMLGTIAGYDPMDLTSLAKPVPDYAAALKKDIKGLKIGMPKEYFIKGLSKEIEDAVRKSIDTLKKNGAKIVEISLPHTEYAVACYYIIAPAEASANLARFDGVRYGHRAEAGNLLEMYMKTRRDGFGDEVRRRIMLGTYVLSSGYYDAYYRKGQQVRRLIREDFDRAFEKVDCIISPTAPTTAFHLGEKFGDPLTMYLADVFTISANVAGLPAISIPAGAVNGLPVGVQFMARAFDEQTLFNAAAGAEVILR